VGREIQSNLLQVEEKLIPHWPYLEKFRSCNQKYTQKQKFHYDQCHRVRPLPDIPDGLEVWVSTEGRQSRGHVIAPSNAPRSCIVETTTGQLCRNRSHLNPIPDDHQTNTDERPSSDTMSNQSPIMTRSINWTIYSVALHHHYVLCSISHCALSSMYNSALLLCCTCCFVS